MVIHINREHLVNWLDGLEPLGKLQNKYKKITWKYVGSEVIEKREFHVYEVYSGGVRKIWRLPNYSFFTKKELIEDFYDVMVALDKIDILL